MNRSLRLIVGTGLLIALSCVLNKPANTVRAEANKVVTVPYVMREDFQHDSLGQWASYPPAQDIGYEPSLTPTSDFSAPRGRALMRWIKPNRSGDLRFGFIKRVRFSTSSNDSLGFSYRVTGSSTPATIEIGLAEVNGRLFKTNISVNTNEWSVVTLSLDKLRDTGGSALSAHSRVEAVYVVANLQHTNPDNTYRFLIDDIELTAAREAAFDIKSPLTESVDPWPTLLSATTYRAGDTVAIEAIAPARLARVDCVLRSQDQNPITTASLYDDGSHGDKRAGDGVWSNSAIYRIRTSDPTGIWLMELLGTTVDGSHVATSVRQITLPQSDGLHPRLFFGAADRQKLIDRSRDPKLASLWTYLQTTAKTARASGALDHGSKVFEMLDKEYLLPSLLAYFDVLNRARFRIAYNAFEAYITGSVEARNAAKEALLTVSRWTRWEPPWFNAHGQHTYYPAGLLAADVALGYDLLYDDLTPGERALVRQALIERAIEPTFKEYVADNRIMANTSNWLAHTVGGALIAASSIAGDVQPSESKGRFHFYVNGLLQKFEDHIKASFLADGSYGEGISYHEFDAETLGPAVVAIQRTFGIDYWKQTHILDSLMYDLYTLAHPVSASVDMGDTHPPAGHGIPALAFKSKDPVVRWYYSQFDRPSLSKFIFYDNSVEPKAPTLPTSRIFWDKGNAVFRSGWAKDDLVFLFRAGPNFNHHHADQGSFLLSGFGENLISEAGWSDYYKDPYYATFFTQAVGHNTVLVEGNPESQSIADTPQFSALNNYPRITDAVTTDFRDSLSSELSSVYQNRLEQFTRRIVFVKPHYFVVFDELKVKGAPARLDWLLHLPNRNFVDTAGDLVVYRGKGAALAVRKFAPDDCEMNILPGRVPYPEFAARTPATLPAAPAYLNLTTRPATKTNLLAALIPSRSVESARSLAANMSEIHDSKWLGIMTKRTSETDLVMFRVTGVTGSASYGQWLTDAVAWTVTESNERPSILSAHSVSMISLKGRTLFRSDKPVSFAAQFNADAIVATVSVTQSQQIRFATGAAPTKVQLDGQIHPANKVAYTSAEQTTSITVPPGRHDIVFVLR